VHDDDGPSDAAPLTDEPVVSVDELDELDELDQLDIDE
jgi:hypothetical protein